MEEGGRAHRQEMLADQLEEIERARLEPGEEEVLARERERLAHAQVIQEACLRAHQTLYGGTPSAVDLLAEAEIALRSSPDPEGHLAAQREALAAALAEVEEVAREVRRCGEAAEAHPQQLAHVEERLDLIARLRRKYGGTVKEVLALADQARRDLAEVERGQGEVEELRQALESALWETGVAAWELSLARREAATRLEAAMATQLADLHMERVQFAVGLERPPVRVVSLRPTARSTSSQRAALTGWSSAWLPTPARGCSPWQGWRQAGRCLG